MPRPPLIIYGNTNITQIAMKNCMKNNIITIPKNPELRELLLDKCSQTTIKINEKEYPIDTNIHIDIDTSKVYTNDFPHHLEKTKPKVVILIICHYSEMNMMMLDILRRQIRRNQGIHYYIVASRFSQTNPKEIELDNDIIFVNQKEAYFNILNKTLNTSNFIRQIDSLTTNLQYQIEQQIHEIQLYAKEKGNEIIMRSLCAVKCRPLRYNECCIKFGAG
jgi:hypothetical protein